ncbi:MAG: hypothetical protein L6R28_09960 [Planctomycetes bacterium]|nr:hypothetical protein [Planctomycetota bacterium]
MVLIFKTLVDLWCERLAWIEAAQRSGQRDSWRLQFERRILSYLIRRFGLKDRPPPAQARPLEPEDHKRSEQLKLSAEAMERLGIKPAKDDPRLLEDKDWQVPYDRDWWPIGPSIDATVAVLFILAIIALVVVCLIATH